LKKDDVVYATFDYMQRGLGNGSCGPGTESQYHCPSYQKFTHTLRVSTVNGAETSIGEVGVNGCEVKYDKAKETVVCNGVGLGAEVAVYNLGGMPVGKPAVSGSDVAVSLAGEPQGAYILVIKNGDNMRTHRFVKW
jgi:beta-galactosidase